jgi:iron complex transport system ATP-binding protein
MSDEVLRLRGVEVRRDAAVLLRNVDWTAHENERWILIGPNGAGKTTLLQVAATTLFPSEGTVDVLGGRLGEVDIFDLRPRIGLTSSSIAEQVPPGEKVIDLVLTAAYAILGRWKEDYDSADVTRAVEMLDALGCAHLIRRRFSTLSEGERKRVQIARALMPDPELLLLDEPAAGLDLGGREDLLRRLTALARDPKAPMMVLVTHHVEEVPDGFTHAMLLRRGSVLASGPIDEVFTAKNLSKTFGIQLEIEHRQSRWTARARLVVTLSCPLLAELAYGRYRSNQTRKQRTPQKTGPGARAEQP